VDKARSEERSGVVAASIADDINTAPDIAVANDKGSQARDRESRIRMIQIPIPAARLQHFNVRQRIILWITGSLN
jgi:hypothetical protein